MLAVAGLTLVVGCGGDDETSPDLAFVSTRDGDYAIYQMSRDGSGQRRLTDHDVDASSPAGLFFQVDPAWSPDGTRIAFSSRRSGSNDLYVMNADGTGTRQLTSTKADDLHPTWSPDGKRIAFARSGEIFVANADGSSARSIVASSADDSEPAWSPDSARIVFSSNRDSEVFELYTIGVDGKGLRSVAPTSSDVFEPSWAPDGSRIAFSEEGAIFTVELGGGEVEQLTSTENNDSSPAWNPKPPPADE